MLEELACFVLSVVTAPYDRPQSFTDTEHAMQDSTSVCRYRDIIDRLGDRGLGFCTASRRSSCMFEDVTDDQV